MKHITLVRHAVSIGNKSDKSGTDETEAWRKRHNATWSITDNGKEDAQRLGELIKQSEIPDFDAYYTSYYKRALQTALHMNLPNAEWIIEPLLREKASGIPQHHPYVDRSKIAPYYFDSLASSAFDTRAYNGESMANLYDRLSGFMTQLDSAHVIIVGHGYAIRVMCMIIEKMTPWEFNTHFRTERIQNCGMIRYTLSKEQILKESTAWINNSWNTATKRIKSRRSTYSNAQIQAILEKIA